MNISRCADAIQSITARQHHVRPTDKSCLQHNFLFIGTLLWWMKVIASRLYVASPFKLVFRLRYTKISLNAKKMWNKPLKNIRVCFSRLVRRAAERQQRSESNCVYRILTDRSRHVIYRNSLVFVCRFAPVNWRLSFRSSTPKSKNTNFYCSGVLQSTEYERRGDAVTEKLKKVNDH